MKRSMRRASFGDMYGARSKFFTSPAIWLARRAGSKRVMRVMPDFPASALAQASAALLPMGQTMPRAVTTTRLRLTCFLPSGKASGLGVPLDVVDGLLDGRDLLGFLVRDLGLELFLERHHQLDGVERISAEVVDERGLVLDLGLVYAELLGNDFLNGLLDVLHAGPPERGRILRHIHAAVDVQHRARHVGGARRSERRDRSRHIGSRAEPSERNLREERGPLRFA